jgi:hypothetical protein
VGERQYEISGMGYFLSRLSGFVKEGSSSVPDRNWSRAVDTQKTGSGKPGDSFQPAGQRARFNFRD